MCQKVVQNDKNALFNKNKSKNSILRKKFDLIIAGEWMPLRFFKNLNNSLIEVTDQTGLSDMKGMWRSLAASDIDRDGDMDLVAGNLGLNCIYHVSPQEPMQLFSKDLDGNGSIDPIFFYYIKDMDGKRKLFRE